MVAVGVFATLVFDKMAAAEVLVKREIVVVGFAVVDLVVVDMVAVDSVAAKIVVDDLVVKMVVDLALGQINYGLDCSHSIAYITPCLQIESSLPRAYNSIRRRKPPNNSHHLLKDWW
jgi:hypothetical protein